MFILKSKVRKAIELRIAEIESIMKYRGKNETVHALTQMYKLKKFLRL